MDSNYAQLLDWASGSNSMAHHQQSDRVNITVDREKFITTRNALTNAFVGLSGAIDTAVKAYVSHTNAVLDGIGGATLDVSGLVQPFNDIGHLNHVAQLAQQAILQNGMTPIQQNPALNPDGSRRKRQYKPRDPNAPKRPLTAYFRYLQEQRPLISKELQAGNAEGGKAGDISKIATERWNSLDEKTRRPYRQAYESELGAYTEAVKQYKAATGQDVDNTQVEEEDSSILPTPAPNHVQAPVDAKHAPEDEESDDDDDDSSDDDSSESASSSSSEDPTPPPVSIKKSKSPELAKKTPKSAKKTAKAGADPVAPVQQFPGLQTPYQAQAADMTPSQSKKRKGDDANGTENKKRKRKSEAQQQEEDAAAAASQLQIDPQLQQSAEKPKKDKKKKRKSEVVAGS